MKQKLKEIDWKEVGWNFLKLLLFLILNIPTIVMLIGKMISIDLQLKNGDVFSTDWFDFITKQGPWYTKIIFYLAIAFTLTISFFIIKWLWEQKREDKRTNKQIQEQQANTNKIIEAINNKKDKEKEEKNVSKYL